MPESAALLVVVAGDDFEAAKAGGDWLSRVRLSVEAGATAGFGLGPIDIFARHPAFQNAHELTTSVPELFNPGADRNNVSPLVGVEVVLRYAPPDGVNSAENQHGMRMALVSGAGEPPERLCIGPRAPDARRIKRGKIKLSVAVSGLRRLRIAIRHFLVGYRIRCIGNGACKESGTANDC